MSIQIDYRRWLNEINRSNSKYKPLFVGGRAYPPIFFFGDPEDAVVATVGVNPSAREFSIPRKWGPKYSSDRSRLLGRCRRYFHKPMGVPHACMQLIDLSLDLVENDLKYFIGQLRAYPSIKYLYVAGAVTKKYYGIEFLEKNSGHLGFTLKPIMPFKRGGQGQVGLYKLDIGDALQRYLFFCSTSPSARVILHPLPQKAHWLTKYYPEFLPSDKERFSSSRKL